MNFILIGDALETTLEAQAAGRFNVLTHKTSRVTGEFYEDDKRVVQIYFEEGDIPKGESGRRSTYKHELTFKVLMTASKRAQADLAVIENPEATQAQRALAASAMKTASYLAERSLNELYAIVRRILMDNRYKNLGLGPTIVIDPWVGKFKKLNMIDRSRQGISELYGDLVVLLAEMEFTCHTMEDREGEIPDAVQPKTVDISTSFQEDNLGNQIVDSGVTITQ